MVVVVAVGSAYELDEKNWSMLGATESVKTKSIVKLHFPG